MKYAMFCSSSKTVGGGTLYTILGKPKFVALSDALYNQATWRTQVSILPELAKI